MHKTIRKRLYDTDTASVVKKCTVGQFGDPDGYEETLYQTSEGHYFLYVCGGPASPYAEEDIQSMAKAKVKLWLAAHE